MDNQFKMLTALTPEECASRLVAAIDHESLDLSRLRLGGGSKPVLGEVTADSFVLRKRLMGRNSFQTYATGTFQPTAGGTVVSGKFSAHPGFRPGYWGWGCLMLFIGVPILLHLLYILGSGAIHFDDLWDPSYQTERVGLLFLVAGPVLFAMCRGAAAGEDDFLRNFLQRTLETRAE